MAKKGPRKYVVFFYREKQATGKDKVIILRESILNTRNTEYKNMQLRIYSHRSRKYELCSCKIKEK